MGSRRLPGKVLAPIVDRPLLQYLLERLARCVSLDAVVVATSTEPADDPVARFCEERRIPCHRGPAENVAGRIRDAVAAAGFDVFVRVNGDSPLLDPGLVQRGIAVCVRERCDIATNVFPRSFPAGQSVEVLNTRAFERGYGGMRDPADLEHVTPFFYRHADEFAIHNFSASRDYGSLRLVVDTPEDLVRITSIVGRMDEPHWQYGLDEVAELAA
jgi:spore coat polysaccharide biosynthesis protein SpsF